MEPQNGPLKLFPYAEVAELMGVGRRTVTSWVSSGQLPVVWVGPRSPRILESDLEAFVEERRVSPLEEGVRHRTHTSQQEPEAPHHE